MTNDIFINYVESHYDYSNITEINEDALNEWYDKAKADFNKNNKSTIALDIVNADKRVEVELNNRNYFDETRNIINNAEEINQLPTINENYTKSTVNKLKSLVGRKESTIERLSALEQSFQDITSEFVEKRRVRSVRVLANQFNVSEEEATDKLREIGYVVEEGKIIR